MFILVMTVMSNVYENQILWLYDLYPLILKVLYSRIFTRFMLIKSVKEESKSSAIE